MQEKKIDVPFLHLLFLLSSSFLKEYSERERETRACFFQDSRDCYIYIVYYLYPFA
jgi:hypothetical protein